MDTLDVIRGLRDEELQDWLRKVAAEDLALALVGADEGIKVAVYRNMSPRAKSLLASDVVSLEEQDPPHAERTRAIRTVLQHL